MAFRDGLHNRVDIYPAVHKEGNRTEKDQLKVTAEQARQQVSCRIIHDEKALFEPGTEVSSGNRLVDLDSGKSYEVMKVRSVYGKSQVHHLSCEIRVWGLDGQNPYSNR